MPSASTDTEYPPRRRGLPGVRSDLGPVARRATMTARAVAFWSAVTLPFASLVVLFGGAVTRVDFLVLLVLVSANVVALYFGRSYALERVENNAYTDGGDDDTGGDAEVAPEESRIER